MFCKFKSKYGSAGNATTALVRVRRDAVCVRRDAVCVRHDAVCVRRDAGGARVTLLAPG